MMPFRQALQHCYFFWMTVAALTSCNLVLQGAELPVKELDSLLHFLGERKRKLDQEEAESNIEVLLDFLHRSRHHKQEELHEVSRSHFFFMFPR